MNVSVAGSGSGPSRPNCPAALRSNAASTAGSPSASSHVTRSSYVDGFAAIAAATPANSTRSRTAPPLESADPQPREHVSKTARAPGAGTGTGTRPGSGSGSGRPNCPAALRSNATSTAGHPALRSHVTRSSYVDGFAAIAGRNSGELDAISNSTAAGVRGSAASRARPEGRTGCPRFGIAAVTVVADANSCTPAYKFRQPVRL